MWRIYDKVTTEFSKSLLYNFRKIIATRWCKPLYLSNNSNLNPVPVPYIKFSLFYFSSVSLFSFICFRFYHHPKFLAISYFCFFMYRFCICPEHYIPFYFVLFPFPLDEISIHFKSIAKLNNLFNWLIFSLNLSLSTNLLVFLAGNRNRLSLILFYNR